MIHDEVLLNAIIDNISNSIITIDAQGTIQTINQAVEDMFGYSESELVNNNVKMIMSKAYAELHDAFLMNYLTTKQAKIIGKSREVEGQRKNGEIFEIELFVYELGLDSEHRFLGIIRDISGSKYVEQMKTEFISTVSHELRTPLTSIKGSLGMINSGVLGELPDKAKRMVTLAHNNTERLISLVNDLLDVEKIQAGKIDLHFEKVNLTQLVQESVQANQAYVNNLNVAVVLLSSSDDDIFIEADENRMMQVMANLISNAAKYSIKGGQVEITIESDGKLVKVSIIDYGLGIPEQYHAKMFQKFSQVDSSDTRLKGGTGLGLNITKAIVEKHGGQINFESEVGQGSTFFFTVPLWEEPNAEIILSEPLVAKRKYAGKILVLEDEPDVARILVLMLEQQNYFVTTCASAEQAKEILLNESFDAMTVDIRLPGQDGLSLIKELRLQKETENLPMIIVSVEASNIKQSYISSCLNVIDWIEKPIDQQQLVDSISKTIKKETAPEIKILYVEDDTDLTQMISVLLEDKLSIVSATTVQQAKQCLHDEVFDLLILDESLPDGSGLDILPFLDKNFSTLPIIVFSAVSLSEDVINKVDAALIKSNVSNDELVETIKRLINLK